MTLRLGYSPCPNDTFIFHALAHGLVHTRPQRDPALAFDIALDDVEALNRRALAGTLDVTKLSYHAYFRVADRFVMLPSGGALGRGVGPLIVTREPLDTLAGRTVATPGGLTTASLLLDLWLPQGAQRREVRYDRIMPAVAAGEVDAGLIIHESRFTYPQHGLLRHCDLGAWWEAETGLPLPLGGVAARRDLGVPTLTAIDALVRASLEHARRAPEASAAYVAAHAQELSAEVRRRHIELYVNRHSLDLGAEGRAAVRELQRRAQQRGLVPAATEPLLFDPATTAAANR